jgi:cell division septum initiation protein DivIVA
MVISLLMNTQTDAFLDTLLRKVFFNSFQHINTQNGLSQQEIEFLINSICATLNQHAQVIKDLRERVEILEQSPPE